MKGIVLAGGSGTRLYPITQAVSKQLLPIYDKPMIYYPLSTLMLAGIRDILVITTQADQSLFQRLLGDGSKWGIHLSFMVQQHPRGIADAFRIGRDFIGKDRVALILGDNIFFGHGLPEILHTAVRRETGATVFTYQVRDPERYGVIAFDKDFRVTSIEEKPALPHSNWAVTGLYIYDNKVIKYAEEIMPSARGELEITDVNARYLVSGELYAERMGRGYAWLDAGTFESLLDAGTFVQTLDRRQGMKIASPEEVAYRMNFISNSQLKALAAELDKSGYGEYLLHVLRP